MYKSSTGNNLCGVDNPRPDLTGQALERARQQLPFKNSPFDDETEGDSVTEECSGRRGQLFYVIDTPALATRAPLRKPR